MSDAVPYVGISDFGNFWGHFLVVRFFLAEALARDRAKNWVFFDEFDKNYTLLLCAENNRLACRSQ